MTHEQRFQQFHQQHPEVYAELVRMAREARAAGFNRFGMPTIWETMRWHFAMHRDPRSEPPPIPDSRRISRRLSWGDFILHFH
jgi:hypothetical protein